MGWISRPWGCTPPCRLAAFTLAAATVFHGFWAVPAAGALTRQQAFFKNIAIAGGLLLLAALGPGRVSFDGRRNH
ncbi:hypothetical protein DBA29_27875 [Xenophilus aerolatus]|nr:hypothetical protein [Xenophilus aerolatus]